VPQGQGENAPATGDSKKARKPPARKGASSAKKITARKTTSAKAKTRTRHPVAPAFEVLTVTEAVKRDLRRLAERDPELANSGTAAAALALAREIDESDNSATSKSMCAKALQDILAQLRELAPTEEGRDGIDDLSAKRNARIAQRAG
jgi:predicted phage-related endonuclease